MRLICLTDLMLKKSGVGFFPTINTKSTDSIALFSKNNTFADSKNKLPNQRRPKAKLSGFAYYHQK